MRTKFNKFLQILRPQVEFEPIDPLGDGLGDAILAERNETQAINLDESDDSDTRQFWRAVEDDLHAGNLVEFSDDE